MSEVLYLLACYGLTFLICDATIFGRVRDYMRARSKVIDGLVSCYFCAGFWSSAFWYLVIYPEPQECLGFEKGISWELWFWWLAHAFAGAAFSFALDVVLTRLEVTPMMFPPEDDSDDSSH